MIIEGSLHDFETSDRCVGPRRLRGNDSKKR